MLTPAPLLLLLTEAQAVSNEQHRLNVWADLVVWPPFLFVCGPLAFVDGRAILFRLLARVVLLEPTVFT